MKRINLLLVWLFLNFLNFNSFAECPPNWNSRGIFIDINGCRYFVVYCYKCGVTGPDDSNVRITYYARLPREQQPNPDNCDDSEIPFEIIKQRVIQDFYIACEMPNCNEIPPQQPLKILLEYPLCERYHNIAWWDEVEQKFKHFLWGESCNNNIYYCQIIRWCCRLGPNEYYCNTTNILPQGNAQSCFEPPAQLLPPKNDPVWNESWDTECFRVRNCEEIK